MNDKIKGLRKIAGESKKINGPYGPGYLEVFFNTSTGEAWRDYHVGRNSFSVYNNRDVIAVGVLDSPATMEEIAEMISDKTKIVS